MIHKSLVTALLASAALTPVAAHADPRVLFSTGGLTAGQALAGRIATTGGVTQIQSDNGALVSFNGNSVFVVKDGQQVEVELGNFTMTAGVNGDAFSVATSGNARVTVNGQSASASFAVDTAGSLSGRALSGSVMVDSNGARQTFAVGQAFNAARGAAPRTVMATRAQPVAAVDALAIIRARSQAAQQYLANASLTGITGGRTGIVPTTNAALATFQQGSVADLLAYAIALQNAVGTPQFRSVSQQYLSVQLVFLRSGGKAGAFTDAGAATSLSAYLDFLRTGGNAANYSAASAALIQAYLTYIQSIGIPSGLAADQQKVLNQYYALVKAGGNPANFNGATISAALQAYVQFLSTGGSGTSPLSANLLQVYLDYLSAYGIPTGFDAASAAQITQYRALVAAGGSIYDSNAIAKLLANYVTYLNGGGTAGGYTGYSAALLQVYLNYLRALGLPSGLDASTSATLISYFSYLDKGGSFGTVPAPVTPEPPAPTPTGSGVAKGAIVRAAYAASGFSTASGGAAVTNICFDANGKPTNLGSFGQPGTATLAQFLIGDGYVLGRWAGGTYAAASGTTTFAANGGGQFAITTPLTALPTGGSAQYAVTSFTDLSNGQGYSNTLANTSLVMNLGVAFGSAPKFGYDGKLGVTFNGTPSSVSFTTPGGSAAPSLTTFSSSTGGAAQLEFFGTAGVTASSGNLCSPISACKVDAYFNAGGGADVTRFAATYALVATSGSANPMNGAAVLGRTSGAATYDGTPTTPTTPVVSGAGLGANASIASPTAVSGFYSGGPGDPGAPIITTDASGKPTSLGYYGKPGTAILTQYQEGTGWMLGRFGNGSFVTGGSSGTLNFGPNDAVHFVSQAPVANLPTSGTAQYTTIGFTEPTVVGGASSFDNPSVVFNLGAQFGSTPKFGYDGKVSGIFNSAASSVTFTTAGGSAAPSLTNTGTYSGTLALFGTATVTASTGNLCSPLSACKMNANFVAGGDGAATFGVGWGLIATATGNSVLNGAAILGKAAAAPVTPVTPVTPAGPVLPSSVTLVGNGAKGNKVAVFEGAKLTSNADGSIDRYSVGNLLASRNSASAVDFGIAATGTSVVDWSRWADGTPNGTPNGLTAPGALTANQGIVTVAGTPLTNRPTSGSAQYVLLGATKPVIDDGSFTPGTFTGGMAVDFATSRVGIDAKVAIGGSTYTLASTGGTASPAQSSIAYSAAGQINGTVTVAAGGICTTGCPGNINGALFGDGALQAGITYGIMAASGRSIFGVAAFGKQ